MAWLVQVALNMMQHLNEGVCGGLALHRAVLPGMDVWRHHLAYPPAHKVLQHLAHKGGGGERSTLILRLRIRMSLTSNLELLLLVNMTSGDALRPRNPGPTWLLPGQYKITTPSSLV